MGDLTRMRDYLASKRQDTVSRHPAGKGKPAPSFVFVQGFKAAIAVVENEQRTIKKANGATRSRERDYDRGYEVALNDIVILLNENVSGSA